MLGATASSQGDLDTQGCFWRLAALSGGSSVVSLGEGTSEVEPLLTVAKEGLQLGSW